jgi:hypothetical protein
MNQVRLRRQRVREQEVMDSLRQSRWVSVFWLQEPSTRWAALNRMEKRGEISVKVMGYPMYRVTIHKPNNAVSGGAAAPCTPRAGSGCGCFRCTRESGRTVNGLPEEMTRMIVCPRCGNKRCPHAIDHRNACTNSNEPGQPGSVYGPNARLDRQEEGNV